MNRDATAGDLWGQEIERALGGDRTGALALWREVAAGRNDPEVLQWLQQVAHRILAADAVANPGARAGAIMRAAGLGGKLDKHRDLRRHLDVLRSFEDLDTGRSATRAELEQYAVDLGLVSDEADVRSIVDRELAKLPVPDKP